MNKYVADTMAIILWIEKRKMPQKAKGIFGMAENSEAMLYVPAMVFAEIGYLSEKSKIDITLQDAFSYVNDHGFHFCAMDIEIIRNAFEINDIPELHDRLIAAAGKVYGCPVITNDSKIIASKFVSTVWG
jgi:predicted nucleic acid-binding protein